MTLPLFLHVIQPIGIVVVNNEVIEHTKTQTNVFYPDRTLELLIELYSNTKYRKKLPAVLQRHLEESTENHSGYCLIGAWDVGCGAVYMCLKFEVDTIRKDSNKILLKNLSYNRDPIEGEIELDVRDFFFILANLSVEFLTKLEIPLDQIEAYLIHEKENSYVHKKAIRLFDFAYDYLKYIKEELKEGRLRPIEILRNSGINTLIMLKDEESVTKFIDEALINIQLSSDHTKNHKLIVDCFYECLKYEYL